MEIGRVFSSFQNLDFSQLLLNIGPEILALLTDKASGPEAFFQQLITRLLSEVNNQSFKHGEIAKSALDPKGILTEGKIHPELAEKIEMLLAEAQTQGLDVFLFEGFRSVDKQNALYDNKQGVTQASGGNSYHNYGLAVDIVFKDEHGNPSWSEKHDWQKLGAIGKSLGLVWGGDFNNLKDRTHFEFHPRLNITDTKNAFAHGGKDFLWNLVSRQSK